ncbi:hypothetical protein [Fibrobacter sp. UWS1]|nr:hypothetical protein [Fibrobacter sp. UWS1]
MTVQSLQKILGKETDCHVALLLAMTGGSQRLLRLARNDGL